LAVTKREKEERIPTDLAYRERKFTEHGHRELHGRVTKRDQ